MIINRETAHHYIWGQDCDGWVYANHPDLLIIEERMPPGTSEHRHHHVRARQFFQAIDGTLTIEIEGQFHDLQAGDGLEIAPGRWHQVINRSETGVRFINVSSPSAHGDRIDEGEA